MGAAVKKARKPRSVVASMAAHASAADRAVQQSEYRVSALLHELGLDADAAAYLLGVLGHPFLTGVVRPAPVPANQSVWDFSRAVIGVLKPPVKDACGKLVTLCSMVIWKGDLVPVGVHHQLAIGDLIAPNMHLDAATWDQLRAGDEVVFDTMNQIGRRVG